MSEYALDEHIRAALNDKLMKLENALDSDVIFFYGSIYPSQENKYRDLIEMLQKDTPHSTLTIVLNTPGGDVITVEKLANINRHFYKTVNFIVPDYAMSAGTVFCLSGDNISMEYSSSLGPIDPQVFSKKQNRWVPALGYLDEMNEAIEKSKKNNLSNAEYLLLKDLDFAFLKECEQHLNLTIQLIKEWLIKYKFSTWTIHSKTGLSVTPQEKAIRAESIASTLGDNKKWYAHGRFIGIIKLREILHLQIHDYGNNPTLQTIIRDYNSLMLSYMHRNKRTDFFHSRNFF